MEMIRLSEINSDQKDKSHDLTYKWNAELVLQKLKGEEWSLVAKENAGDSIQST